MYLNCHNYWGACCWSLVFCVMCLSFFFWPLALYLSVLRFTAFDYTFVVFKLLGWSCSCLYPILCPPFKMAAVTKNRNFFNYLLLLYYRSKWAQILTAATWPLSAIFQLYHGDQFYWWKKPEYPDRPTDHGQATGKLYHLQLWVECTLFFNLQSRARTHSVLVIGLYELLGNPTT